jgi:hypothetical protein
MMGWRLSFHSARAFASSGLSCSDARRVFFEAEPAGDQKLRKGRGVSLDAFGLRQLLRQFGHGDVVAGRDSSKYEVPVGAKLAMPEAATWAGIGASDQYNG